MGEPKMKKSATSKCNETSFVDSLILGLWELVESLEKNILKFEI